MTGVKELSQDTEYYKELKLCQGTVVDPDVFHGGWCLPLKVCELEVSWGKTQASFTTVLCQQNTYNPILNGIHCLICCGVFF